MKKNIEVYLSRLIGSLDQSTTGTKFSIYKPNG